MPRGAIAKRSKSPGIAGPPGPAGLGPFAFQSIAVMAAFPAGALVDGVDAHVFTLDELWSYDPSSTLAPDVSAYAPLGITIVAANGPGNWTRREATSLRWRERATWFVDPIAGLDERSGATALTAVGTFAEVMRRLQGLPAASTGYDITIMSDLHETVVIDTSSIGGTQAPYIHAAPILLFAGVITAHVDYNDATQTVGTVTCAGLPVSWTASGLVGKLVRMPNSAGVTIEFWVMQDMGAKTARISPPQAGIFTTAVATVTDTAFEAYDLVQFGDLVSVISSGGEGQQVDFELLELGAAGIHTVEFKQTGALVESCILNGLDTSVAASPIFYNCKFASDARADGGSRLIFANGYLPSPGGGPTARAGATLDFTRFVTYNGWLVQGNALSRCVEPDGWNASISLAGAGTAFSVDPGGILELSRLGPGRLWGVGWGVGGVGLGVQAGGMIAYDNTKPPLITAPAVEVLLGQGLIKTLAQLPYTDPITSARIVNEQPPDPTEDYFVALAVDSDTVLAAFTVLVTQTITVNGLRDVLFDVTFSTTIINSALAKFGLFIDGVQVIGSGVFAAITLIGGGSMRWKAALAAGAHTITVQWCVNLGVGQAFCRPVTEPTTEHCTLTVRELYG